MLERMVGHLHLEPGSKRVEEVVVAILMVEVEAALEVPLLVRQEVYLLGLLVKPVKVRQVVLLSLEEVRVEQELQILHLDFLAYFRVVAAVLAEALPPAIHSLLVLQVVLRRVMLLVEEVQVVTTQAARVRTVLRTRQ